MSYPTSDRPGHNSFIFHLATFNCLHPDYASQKQQPWAVRSQEAQTIVQISKADVACLQECNQQMLTDLTANTNFSSIFAQHRDKPDGVGILFDKTRFQLDRKKIKTVYGTNGWATVFADLTDYATQKTIRVASVHLQGGPDRTLGEAQLASALPRILNEDASEVALWAIGGDFNEEMAKNNRIKKLTDLGFIHDGSHLNTEPGHKRKIDHILVHGRSFTDNAQISSTATIFNERVSDHCLFHCSVSSNLLEMLPSFIPSRSIQKPQTVSISQPPCAML